MFLNESLNFTLSKPLVLIKFLKIYEFLSVHVFRFLSSSFDQSFSGYLFEFFTSFKSPDA